jgi:replicative DNA helicase
LSDLEFGLYTNTDTVRKGLGEVGFSADEVEASGLTYDSRWASRLVGPWRDRWGHIATLYSRDLTATADDSEKYLFLLGTRKEALVAFGLDVALRTDTGVQDLILVEGLIDVVSLQHRGFKNIAGIGGSGKEFSTARLEALTRFGVRTVTLLLDNDPRPDGAWPGRDGTIAIIELVQSMQNGPQLFVVDPRELGVAKDPDEFVRNRGLEAFHAVVATRKSAAFYRVSNFLEGITPLSPDPQRRQAVDQVLTYEAGLRGPRASLDREDLLRLTADRTGYTYATLADLATDHENRLLREATEHGLGRVLQEAQASLKQKSDVFEVLHQLGEHVDKFKAQRIESPLPFSIERLDKETRQLPAGKRSGWRTLNRLEVALNPGELTIVGARTGHAKTTFLANLLARFLSDAGNANADEIKLLYSLEEPEVCIYHRLLAYLCMDKSGEGWTVNEVRDFLRDPYSRGTDYAWPNRVNLDVARQILRSWEKRLMVVYRPAWDVTEIAAHARTLNEQHAVGAVFVDYLQRVRPPKGRYDRRDIEVSLVGRHLKALAVDLSAPVIVGAQINRDAVPEKYTQSLSGRSYQDAIKVIRKARPELHHLREGGAEQEADVIIGLLNYAADYRTELGEEAEKLPDVTRLEVGILKNRYGRVGQWTALAFEGKFGFIRDPGTNEEI